MHPFALTQYPRGVAVTRSRSSRRRARRAAIAVVVGLLGTGTGQAFADPPQVQFHPHLPGSHANVSRHTVTRTVDTVRGVRQWHEAIGRSHAPVTGGRTQPAGSPSDGGSFDAWPAVLIVTAAALLGGVALTRRHRLPSTT
jgi:hypothetical protein